MKKDAAKTRPKPGGGPADERAPMPQDMARTPRSGLDPLFHVMPVAGLHLSPPGQPDDETMEAGFDNMPV